MVLWSLTTLETTGVARLKRYWVRSIAQPTLTLKTRSIASQALDIFRRKSARLSKSGLRGGSGRRSLADVSSESAS